MMDIDLYLGKRGLLHYHIGDQCLWVMNKQQQNGGRPPNGDIDGEGYTECPCCARDFFVTVEVRSDHLVAAIPNLKKPGFKKQ